MKQFFLIIFCCCFGTVFSQGLKDLLPENKLTIRKTGPFLGVEKGKYFFVNFGMEHQIQQLKLIKPRTHAMNFQLDYNFTQNVVGANVGYWMKQGRLNITYGARIRWQNDFEAHNTFGIGPNVGYKFLQAHFQLGAFLSGGDVKLVNGNGIYASLRWVFINERKIRK